ncbi:MAG: hypothetical protein ACYDGO_06280 [Smithellaceae bacterium]
MKKESKEVSSIILSMMLRWDVLRFRLLGNMFVLNHPELKLDFPFHSGNMNKLDEHFDKSINKRKLFLQEYKISSLKGNQVSITDSIIEQKKKSADLLKRDVWFDSLKNINIRDKGSFRTLYQHCYMMAQILEKIEADVKSGEAPSLKEPVPYISLIKNCFFHSQALTGKYYELVGYWMAKMDGREKKRDSGKGQKEAKQNRVKQLTETIQEFITDNADDLYIDKGEFYDLLCKTFVGADKYPRHHKTVTTYKEEVEHKLGKKIIFSKRRK